MGLSVLYPGVVIQLQEGFEENMRIWREKQGEGEKKEEWFFGKQSCFWPDFWWEVGILW